MNKLLILIFFALSLKSFGQSVTVNYDIDTTVFKVAEPLNLWLDFLNTKDDSLGSKYWNSKEVKKYGETSYFLIEKELQFGMDNYLKLLSYSNIKILSVKKIDEYFKITSIMEFKPKEKTCNVQYIFHVYAGIENGELKLFNPLEINTKLNFNSTTIGYIKYHYPKCHDFDYELAKKQNDYLIDLSEKFKVNIDTVDYYFANSNTELLKARGFDFLIANSGEEIPSGKADPKNRIVYASGIGEYYPHELIHFLLNPHFPNCHLWINEGVATYFGMSRGKELGWHLKKLNEHLLEHPEINLNNMLELKTLDQYTDYRYVLGGLIIKKAFEKGSYELVKKMMNAGKEDTDFYSVIEKYLGIKRQELNIIIRQELKEKY
ncbi:MAG: hypothetical protein JKY30_09235 [Flavobacteriales bacterium]|nr:hypothetical protein [Flavobacteriales bacterium]